MHSQGVILHGFVATYLIGHRWHVIGHPRFESRDYQRLRVSHISGSQHRASGLARQRPQQHRRLGHRLGQLLGVKSGGGSQCMGSTSGWRKRGRQRRVSRCTHRSTPATTQPACSTSVLLPPPTPPYPHKRRTCISASCCPSPSSPPRRLVAPTNCSSGLLTPAG